MCSYGNVIVILMTIFSICYGQKCTPQDVYAICDMKANPSKPSNINGTVYLWQHIDSECMRDFLNIQVNIDNVPMNDGTTKHGFHIHEYGDMSGGCESMGGHYNPNGATHGYGWDSLSNRHVGDLGNVRQKPDGRIESRLVDYLASLFGSESIIGRGLVLHAGEDDLGRSQNDPESLRTGNAGPRLACCVIGLSPPFTLDGFNLYRK